MTEEERDIKRAKDRAYYQKKKGENKVKNIAEMTEREKRKQRKIWKEASKKYREKKKALSSIVNNTPPHSDDNLAATLSVRKTVGRKIVRKDRAKAYQKREQEKARVPTTPNNKVDALIKNVDVTPEVRKKLLFNEVLTTQLKEKASTLKKNSKEREVFQKCVSGNMLREYKLHHMAKIFLPKERTSTSILKSDTKIREVVLKPGVRQKVIDFFQRDDVSRMCPAKRDFINHGSIEKNIEDYSCDITFYDCMNGLCNKCKNPRLEPAADNTNSVTYFQWKSVFEEKTVKGENKTFKITKKVAISSTVKELKVAFIEDIPVMKKHLYGIYIYNKLKKELKENLTEEEVMIDFSENYTTMYANEIQSTHFAKNQLSIHTGVYYIRNVDNGLQSRSFATVSENLDHQAHAIWAHMKPILETILKKTNINILHIYSDGPTSQYRNRTNIHLWLQTLINEFKQISKATWTYSEPGHAKGPMDGVGGADRHVLMGQDIKTALDFVNLFTKSTILVKKIPDADISSVKKLVPKTLDAIPGIMNVTKIKWQRGPEVKIKIYRHERFQKELKMSALSGSLYPNSEPINLGILSRESPELNEHMDTTDVQDLLKLKNQSIYKTIYYSSSSDEDENQILLKLTDVDKDDGEILVTFLRSVRTSAKKFKLELNDVSYITFEQIISIIPTPLMKKENNQEYYYFDTDIDVYEKF
ncbi:unnamed protein product [Brassicogethes aeneus]|uniref:Uncharacterized protein n=1 Tax=Brassicogethes aeneus TaxID=1431903 RepID=A0A9P0FDY7_BRAAE|nr:unnamed protein product [Brassicogethes aeneus]